MVSHLAAREVPVENVDPTEEDVNQYEGAEAIESLLHSQRVEYYEDLDDGMSVE